MTALRDYGQLQRLATARRPALPALAGRLAGAASVALAVVVLAAAPATAREPWPEHCGDPPPADGCRVTLASPANCQVGRFFAPAERARWTGACYRFRATGPGELHLRDGRRLSGRLSRGRPVGRWTETGADGTTAAGEHDSQGRRHGPWVHRRAGNSGERTVHHDRGVAVAEEERHENGRTEAGPLKGGRRHGEWTIHTPKGNVTRFAYANGELRRGTINFDNGAVGTGGYRNGRPHGPWSFRNDSDRWEITYADGVPGSRITHYRDGSTERGPTDSEGLRHGLWIRIAPSRPWKIETRWAHGKRSGAATRRFADGYSETGELVDGVKDGEWRHVRPDGAVETVRWKRGRMDGAWTLTLPDGGGTLLKCYREGAVAFEGRGCGGGPAR